jgi:hypothetical protein
MASKCLIRVILTLFLVHLSKGFTYSQNTFYFIDIGNIRSRNSTVISKMQQLEVIRVIHNFQEAIWREKIGFIYFFTIYIFDYFKEKTTL